MKKLVMQYLFVFFFTKMDCFSNKVQGMKLFIISIKILKSTLKSKLCAVHPSGITSASGSYCRARKCKNTFCKKLKKNLINKINENNWHGALFCSAGSENNAQINDENYQINDVHENKSR